MEARKIAEMEVGSASHTLSRAEGSQLMADGDGRTYSSLGNHPSIRRESLISLPIQIVQLIP